MHAEVLAFKKDVQGGLLEPETAADQPHFPWKYGTQGELLFSLPAFLEFLTLAIIGMWYLF